MAREEVLRAILSARESISRRMSEAKRATSDLSQTMAETAGIAGGLTGALGATESEAKNLERTYDSLANQTISAATTQKILEDQINGVGTSSLEAVMALQAYRESVDESGDEATEGAAKNFSLAASLRAVGAAAGEASVNVGPFNTSVRRAVVALPALIALVGSLTATITGLTVAAGGAAGALGALFAGGLIGRAERLAESSAAIENRWEALQQIFTEVGSEIDRVTESIQGLSQQEGSLSILRGFVTLVGDLANSANELAPLFAAVGDRLDEVFWAEEARGIAELEQTIADLMPILEDITFYILTQLPDFLAWLRQETLKVAPALGDFTVRAIQLTRALTELGGTFLRFLLPALSLAIDLIIPLIDVFNAVPDPVYAAAAAFAAVAGGLYVYSSAAWVATGATISLNAALSTLYSLLSPVIGVLAAIGSTGVALAAIAAVVVGLITYFDLWGDILAGVVGIWNTLVEIVEFSINAMLKFNQEMKNLMGPLRFLIPGLGQLFAIIEGVKLGFRLLTGAIQIVGDMFEWLGRQYEDHIKPWVDEIAELIGATERAVDRAGGVDLGGAKIEQPAAAARGGPSDPNTMAGAGSRARQRTQELRENRSEVNFDFSGATFNGDTSEQDVQRIVERVLDKRRNKRSDL